MVGTPILVKLAVAVLALSFVQTSVQSEGRPGFPRAWEGIYGAGPEDCFVNDYGKSDRLMKVSGANLDGWEWGCEVKGIASGDVETFEVDLSCFAEEDHYSSKTFWRAAEIGGKGFLVEADSNILRIWRKCQ